jgi:BASS family bile acid:Na+ symporter
VTRVELTIQILTCSALVGLLGAVGLRLSFQEVRTSLARCRFTAIVLVNFIAVPAVATAVVLTFGLSREVAIGMILLAAAPFAPVVPVFARMAEADLALAAALTGVFPLISAALTPLAAGAALWVIARGEELHFNIWRSLATLVATITLPLALGVFVQHKTPRIAQRLLKPVEIVSEAIGAASLIFVTVTQYRLIVSLGGQAWIAMAFISEISVLIGWQLGAPNRGSRQVVALGTANRNIALALLIAIQSFHGTAIPSAVVGNGLVLIGLGLLHVAWWRWVGKRGHLA